MCHLKFELQTWDKLPARNDRDVPSSLLPLLAYCTQQERLRGVPVRKRTSVKVPEPEPDDALATIKRAVAGIKYIAALVGFFCVPNDTHRSQLLTSGNETRFTSIAQLLLEAMEHASDSSCTEVAEQLMDWAVDISVTALHARNSAQSDEDQTTEDTEAAQINAVALQEALISARCCPALLCVPQFVQKRVLNESYNRKGW